MYGLFVARISDFVSDEGLKKSERERKAVQQLLQQQIPSSLIDHNDLGAPFLRGAEAAISISHSQDFIALLLRPLGSVVGVDIETNRAKCLRIASRFMDKEELSALDSLNSLPQRELFSSLVWCAKEATYKAIHQASPDLAQHFHLLSPHSIASKVVCKAPFSVALLYNGYGATSITLPLSITLGTEYTLAVTADC